MKKLMLCIIAVLGFALTANAQATVKKTKTKVETVNANGKHAVLKTERKVVKTADKKVVIKQGVVLKKDGTPDKRYKKKTVVLKKDGTPDKRYKVNK